SFRMKRPLMQPGSMPICTVSKAILAMPAIGTGRLISRLGATLSKPNGSGSFQRCCGLVGEHERDKSKTDKRRYRRMGDGDWAGGPCPGHLQLKIVFRRF